MLKLYDYYRSSASFRVRIALNLKGLDYTIIPVHLTENGGEQFEPAYLQVNPQQLVPTLQDDDITISQSLAIIEYLEDAHPSSPLLPKTPAEKALIRSFALSIACDIHPLMNLRVMKYLVSDLEVQETNKQQWIQHWIATGLASLERQLIHYDKAKDFCFGNKITLADICLAPQMYNARRFNCDLSAYPTLVRIDANCQQHPAFVKAWPLEQVTQQ